MKAPLPRTSSRSSLSQEKARRTGSPAPRSTRLQRLTVHDRVQSGLPLPASPVPVEPGLRAAEVERARRLIADLGYPPRKVLQQVAEKLLRKSKFWLLLSFLAL